ncbi:MAG: DUF1700 domain-containing protein [Oscillospiraceae bacterium]|nr:DUF1700 domain-containing protein [Oscillospiraceae bacterium]
MISTKHEFMEQLNTELTRLGVGDKSEILADFEQHFADSLLLKSTESEICYKLGDISEIAKQYAEGETYQIVPVESAEIPQSDSATPPPPNTANPPPPPQQNNYTWQQPPPANQHANYGYSGAGGTGRDGTSSSYNDYANSGIKINMPKINMPKDFDWGGLLTVLCVDIFVLSWAVPTIFAVVISLLTVPFSLIVAGIATIVGGGFGFTWFYSPFPALATVCLGFMSLSLGGLLGIAGLLLLKAFVAFCRNLIDWHGKMITGKPVFKPKQAVQSPQVTPEGGVPQ